MFELGGIGNVKNAGSSTRDLQLVPALRTEYGTPRLVMRGLFKGTDDAVGYVMGVHDIQIQSFTDNYISKVDFINITDSEFSGGDFTSWNSDVALRTIERAAVDNTLTEFHFPTLYYKGDVANFHEATSANHLTQNVSLNPTTDGYKLSFTLGNNLDTNTCNGGVKLNIEGNGYKIQFVALQPGEYEALFNLEDGFINMLNYNGEVIEQPIATTSNQYNSDKVYFSGNTSSTVSVDNVSLVDTTNYFVLAGAEGEGVDGWVIDGFEQTLENYISWNTGQIQFNDSPPSSDVRIYQIIEEDLTVGHEYELSLDFDIEESGFTISYFRAQPNITSNNQEHEGFVEFVSSSNSGHFSTTVSVGSHVNINYGGTGAGLQDGFSTTNINGALIIRGIGSSNTNGTIDNIQLKRVITPEQFGVPLQTISFNEDAKGWVSFKSFIPENGLSLSSQYFTTSKGGLWQHYTNENRNSFYGNNSDPYDSVITTVINGEPSMVKNFSSINYEGSQAAVENIENMGQQVFGFYDTEINTLVGGNENGWSVEDIITDLDSGSVSNFIKKEGKWFNYISGNQILGEIDTSKFNFQGLGVVSSVNN